MQALLATNFIHVSFLYRLLWSPSIHNINLPQSLSFPLLNKNGWIEALRQVQYRKGSVQWRLADTSTNTASLYPVSCKLMIASMMLQFPHS